MHNNILFYREASILRALLSGRILQYVGQISYSFYLWHMATLITIKRLFPTGVGFLNYIIGATLSIIAAVMSFHLVESNINRLRRKWGFNVRIN